MADQTVYAAHALTTAYIRISPRLQRLFTHLGYWRGSDPLDELAALLAGSKQEFGEFYGLELRTAQEVYGWVQRLQNQLRQVGQLSQPDSAALAQFRRRIRESIYGKTKSTSEHPATPLPPRAIFPPVVPFHRRPPPLFGPAPTGKDAPAYQQHVWACMRDIVEFTQTSAYDA